MIGAIKQALKSQKADTAGAVPAHLIGINQRKYLSPNPGRFKLELVANPEERADISIIRGEPHPGVVLDPCPLALVRNNDVAGEIPDRLN